MNGQIARPSESTWKAWTLLPGLALLALAGCGTIAAGPVKTIGPDNQPTVFQKGRVAPETYLSSVVVGQGGCHPYGSACTVAGPMGVIIFLPRVQGAPEWLYEVFAHELCHAWRACKGSAALPIRATAMTAA